MSQKKFKSKTKGFSKEFQSQFDALRNSYFYSLSLVPLLIEETSSLEILDRSHCILKKDGSMSFIKENKNDPLALRQIEAHTSNEPRFAFKQIADSIRRFGCEHDNNNYLIFCLGTLIHKIYESFKDDEERWGKSKNLDWMTFLGNLRHSFAHGIDGVWDLKEYDKSEISYTRRGDGKKILIDQILNGEQIHLENHLGGLYTVFDLLKTVTEFVDENTL